MSHPIDELSYKLGFISAFAEMVVCGVKDLALSPPLSKQEYESIAEDARRVAGEWGAKVLLDKNFLTTDLFPEEYTQDKWVLLIYISTDIVEAYQQLKSRKEQLIKENNYIGEERRSIAQELGKLLSYKMDFLESRLGHKK